MRALAISMMLSACIPGPRGPQGEQGLTVEARVSIASISCQRIVELIPGYVKHLHYEYAAIDDELLITTCAIEDTASGNGRTTILRPSDSGFATRACDFVYDIGTDNVLSGGQWKCSRNGDSNPACIFNDEFSPTNGFVAEFAPAQCH